VGRFGWQESTSANSSPPDELLTVDAAQDLVSCVSLAQHQQQTRPSSLGNPVAIPYLDRVDVRKQAGLPASVLLRPWEGAVLTFGVISPHSPGKHRPPIVGHYAAKRRIAASTMYLCQSWTVGIRQFDHLWLTWTEVSTTVSALVTMRTARKLFANGSGITLKHLGISIFTTATSLSYPVDLSGNWGKGLRPEAICRVSSMVVLISDDS
jgi:hypothetical protein